MVRLIVDRDGEEAMERHVTLRDIAARAGVHFTTVSLALRNHPRISPTCKDRVRQAAEELGYVPDPVMSAFVKYRRAARTPKYQATLAWLNNWPRRGELSRQFTFREYHEGAVERARRLGYVIEEFWLQEKGMTPRKLRQILKARNIDGLLLAPQPHARMFPEIDFSDFSVIAFGYSLQPSIFHVVTNHHFHSITLLLKKLREKGYRRIGFYGEADWDEKLENVWVAGLLLDHWQHASQQHFSPFFDRAPSDPSLIEWLRKTEPDAVISYSGVKAAMVRLGYSIPSELGFVSASMSRDDQELSGIHQNNHLIGEKAVDFLIDMMQRGERGVPKTAIRVQIESEWREGKTLRG